MSKERADKIISSLYPDISRTRAQELIKRSRVFWKKEKVLRPSDLIDKNDLEIQLDEEYVSRGAFKLLGAIRDFNIRFENLLCADFGASTGGFVEVLLKNGARRVHAIDVGHGQLHSTLQQDSRVCSVEGVNLKDPFLLEEKVDAIVVDLSFIGLEKIWHNIVANLKWSGFAVLLFKPQFQVGKSGIGKGGIVKERSLVLERLISFVDFVKLSGFFITKISQSPITGGDGNQEFLLYASREGEVITAEKIQKVVYA